MTRYLNSTVEPPKAKLIDADIVYERFDTTLAKYKPQSFQVEESTITPVITSKNPLVELWERYAQYRSPQLSPGTIARGYSKIAK